MDDEEFIQFLVKEGYAEPEARALVGQVYEDDCEIAPEGFFDISGRDGRTVEVEVDGSMGFAGVLRFIVTGEPSGNSGARSNCGRRPRAPTSSPPAWQRPRPRSAGSGPALTVPGRPGDP